MELGKHSRNRLMGSLNHWHVIKDFAEPMYNYLVHGFAPGGFFTGWYAGDANSIIFSHPSNRVEDLKNLTKWIINCMPPEAKGSYENVHNWSRLDANKRRAILVEWGLVYTEQEETFKLLKGEETQEPFFWN